MQPYFFCQNKGHCNGNPTKPFIVNGVYWAPLVSACKQIGVPFLCSVNGTEKTKSPNGSVDLAYVCDYLC